MSLEVQQLIGESMQAYRAGFKAFESSMTPPSGYKKHEADCFKMGFNAAREGKQYPKSQKDEAEALSADVAIDAYVSGCSDA
jgi:hypothetical protein